MSNDCLEAVERMIFIFCEQFQEIYGKSGLWEAFYGGGAE